MTEEKRKTRNIFYDVFGAIVFVLFYTFLMAFSILAFGAWTGSVGYYIALLVVFIGTAIGQVICMLKNTTNSRLIGISLSAGMLCAIII